MSWLRLPQFTYTALLNKTSCRDGNALSLQCPGQYRESHVIAEHLECGQWAEKLTFMTKWTYDAWILLMPMGTDINSQLRQV